MEDKERNIEDLFRRKLEGFEIKATEADWDAIMGKMPMVPAKRRFVWWYWLSGITGVLVALFMIFKPMNSFQTLTYTNQKSVVSEPLRKTSKKVESASNKHNLKNQTKEKIDKSGNLTKRLQSSRKAVSGNQSNAKSTGKQDNGRNRRNHYKAEIEKSDVSNHKTNIPKIVDSPVEIAKPEILILDISPRRPKFDWLTFDVMALNLIALNHPAFALKKEPIDKPNSMNLNFAVGPYISLNRYKQETTSKDADYDKYRKGTEKPAIMPDIGVKITGKYQNLIFNSGLILGFKGQQTAGLVNHRIYDSVPVFNPDSVLIDYFRFNYRDTSTRLRENNRYSYFEIPLNIGYSVRVNKKNNISLTGGATLSMLIGSKGKIIAPNAPNYTLAENDNTDLFFYNRMLTSWQAAIGHTYQLTETITWNTNIQYRSTLGNIYSKNYPVKMNWNNMGINTSLTFKIGR